MPYKYISEPGKTLTNFTEVRVKKASAKWRRLYYVEPAPFPTLEKPQWVKVRVRERVNC